MPVTVVLRAWRIPTLVGTMVVYALGIVLIAAPIPIPGRDFSDVLWPALPILVVGAVVLSRRVLADVPFEAVHPRRTWRRLSLLIGPVLAVGLVTAVLSPWVDVDPLVAARNTGIMLGVVALCGPSLATAAMLGLAAFSCASWILGAGGMGAPPAWWAVLLHPTGSAAAFFLAVGLLGAGAVIDVRRRE